MGHRGALRFPWNELFKILLESLSKRGVTAVAFGRKEVRCDIEDKSIQVPVKVPMQEVKGSLSARSRVMTNQKAVGRSGLLLNGF